MHDILAVQVFQTLVDILNEGIDLVLRESSLSLEPILESPLPTEFRYKVAMVGTLEDLVATDGVWMVQGTGN